jgi:hypothetical protein
LTFSLAYTSKKGSRDGGLVQIIVNYLVSFGSLLHSDMLDGAVWHVEVAKVCHYGCSPVISFYDIN